MRFTHMTLVKNETHKARGVDYELLVYQVEETGEHRIYVTTGGFGVGDIFTASQEVVQDAKAVNDAEIVEGLIATAKDDINRNEFGLY